MHSLLLHPYNNIKRAILYASILLLLGCRNQINPHIAILPKHFKVETTFMLDGRGIIINTYWGSEKKHHVLFLDNYSPSWIKSSLVRYNQSFIKSNDLSFKTSTADGLPIRGDIGICDSLSFQNIVFTNVPFYIIPDSTNDNKNDDGVLGIEPMSKGIWKIDFKNKQLTFASDIDSFKEINQSELFPASFDQQGIAVKVDFGNGKAKTMYIDLGYNGEMLMPLNEFENISKSGKIFDLPNRFITPAHQNFVNTLSFFDTVNINHNFFNSFVSTNEKVNERLIGLSFFIRFDYVIFDFINKQVYIRKKIW